MLAAILANGVRRGGVDTHDGDDRFIADYVRRRRKRRKEKEQAELAERQEAVTEAYAALQDVPEVREQIRQAMRVDRTPELQAILADYRAIAVLLKRYEAMLEDDEDVIMLLGGV